MFRGPQKYFNILPYLSYADRVVNILFFFFNGGRGPTKANLPEIHGSHNVVLLSLYQLHFFWALLRNCQGGLWIRLLTIPLYSSSLSFWYKGNKTWVWLFHITSN